jgi:hypothetical protein
MILAMTSKKETQRDQQVSACSSSLVMNCLLFVLKLEPRSGV